MDFTSAKTKSAGVVILWKLALVVKLEGMPRPVVPQAYKPVVVSIRYCSFVPEPATATSIMVPV